MPDKLNISNETNVPEKRGNIIDAAKSSLIDDLSIDDFGNEKRFLMPLHDLVVKEINEVNNNSFIASISVPENFDRPHLAGLNFEKISLELIKEINKIKGLEKKFSKILLYESSIICKKEVTDLSKMILTLVKEEDLERDLSNRQNWSFEINNGSMLGKCSVVYKN